MKHHNCNIPPCPLAGRENHLTTGLWSHCSCACTPTLYFYSFAQVHKYMAIFYLYAYRFTLPRSLNYFSHYNVQRRLRMHTGSLCACALCTCVHCNLIQLWALQTSSTELPAGSLVKLSPAEFSVRG